MKLRVSSHLHAYTANRNDIEAEGATLAELFDDLDRRHPGIRFRVIDEAGHVRQHMNLFLNGTKQKTLEATLKPGDDVCIFGALSGG